MGPRGTVVLVLIAAALQHLSLPGTGSEWLADVEAETGTVFPPMFVTTDGGAIYVTSDSRNCSLDDHPGTAGGGYVEIRVRPVRSIGAHILEAAVRSREGGPGAFWISADGSEYEPWYIGKTCSETVSFFSRRRILPTVPKDHPAAGESRECFWFSDRSESTVRLKIRERGTAVDFLRISELDPPAIFSLTGCSRREDLSVVGCSHGDTITVRGENMCGAVETAEGSLRIDVGGSRCGQAVRDALMGGVTCVLPPAADGTYDLTVRLWNRSTTVAGAVGYGRDVRKGGNVTRGVILNLVVVVTVITTALAVCVSSTWLRTWMSGRPPAGRTIWISTVRIDNMADLFEEGQSRALEMANDAVQIFRKSLKRNGGYETVPVGETLRTAAFGRLTDGLEFCLGTVRTVRNLFPPVRRSGHHQLRARPLISVCLCGFSNEGVMFDRKKKCYTYDGEWKNSAVELVQNGISGEVLVDEAVYLAADGTNVPGGSDQLGFSKHGETGFYRLKMKNGADNGIPESDADTTGNLTEQFV